MLIEISDIYFHKRNRYTPAQSIKRRERKVIYRCFPPKTSRWMISESRVSWDICRALSSRGMFIASSRRVSRVPGRWIKFKQAGKASKQGKWYMRSKCCTMILVFKLNANSMALNRCLFAFQQVSRFKIIETRYTCHCCLWSSSSSQLRISTRCLIHASVNLWPVISVSDEASPLLSCVAQFSIWWVMKIGYSN